MINGLELEPNIRRILIALDASPHSLAALEAAAELATNLGAELEGLFIEDMNLIRLAQLPFTQEISSHSLNTRTIDSKYLELQLRTQAKKAKEAIEKIAKRFQLDWSFHTIRGTILAELLSAASEADLTILGKSGWTETGKRKLGSTTKNLLYQTEELTLVLQQGTQWGVPVFVLFDGSEVSKKAINLAIRLVQGKEEALSLLILADTEEKAEKLQTEVSEKLIQQNATAKLFWFTQGSVEHLSRFIQDKGARVLVLPYPSFGVSAETVPKFLENLDCPILIVR